MKDVKEIKAWAILNPDDEIDSTDNAYNHWEGNNALCIFKKYKDAERYACIGLDRIIRVSIKEIKK